MRPRIPICLAVAAVAASAPAGSAAAAGWTPTLTLPVGRDYEPFPRVAIGSDGTSALAFQSKSGRLMLATGRPSGRFTAPRAIDRAGARNWSVAARSGGRFIVVWADSDGIRAAVRTRAGGPVVVRRVTAGNGEEIDGVQVAADPRGGWVVAERRIHWRTDRLYHVRAMTLTPGGRLAGAVQELGPGDFGTDARPTMALAVSDIGRAVLAFTRETPSSAPQSPTVAVSVRPHGGVFTPASDLGGDIAGDPRVAVEGGRAVIAATQVRSRGDAGIFGNPIVAWVGPRAVLGSPFGPPVANPRRAFAPSVAMTPGGRGVLVFQRKPASEPFETRAPVHAVAFSVGGTVGPLQTLTTARAKEPVVMPLAERGALTMWSGARGLGAALATPGGRFMKIATPKGPPPPPFHSNSTNRDLRTGGRWAIFAWSRDADGRVRVSVRRF